MQLIEKDAVLLIIEEIKLNKSIPKNYGTLLDIERRTRQLPTIDAEPIVHGHWIWNEDLHRYECSVCHGECATSFTEEPLFKSFCGDCGAKMDEEQG